MGWETEKLSRTLLIQKLVGPKGKTKYAIYPLMRVITNEGQAYLETVPSEIFGATDVLNFDSVEFIDPPGPARDKDSDLGLTLDNQVGVRRANTVV